jgi:hypothetical protein
VRGGPVLFSQLLNLSLDWRDEALVAGERLEHHSEVFGAETEARVRQEDQARKAHPCCTSCP